MRSVLALLALPFLSVSAIAQDGYPNTCDPSDLFECGSLANRYLGDDWGTPPFPNDPTRAVALKKMQIDGAHAGCSGENYNMCYVLGDVGNPFPGLPETGRYSDLGRIKAYLEYTEEGCANDQASACYWRSVAFPFYNLELIDIGIALEVAKGQSRAQAERGLSEQSALYENLMTKTARTQIATLRAACTTQTAGACAALGGLLFDYDEFEISAFEHIPLLFKGCTLTIPSACFSLKSAIGRLARIKPNQAVEAPVRDQWIAALRGTCANGNAAHCQVLVELSPSNPSLDEASLQDAACRAGAAKSCTNIGRTHLRSYKKSNDPNDLQAAVDHLTRACELENNTACHMLEHLSIG